MVVAKPCRMVEAMSLIVWVLTHESGSYSSYGMSVEGVFASADAAKKWMEADCLRIAEKHRSNRVYLDRTPWQFTDGEWKCEAKGGDNMSWTISDYEVEE